MPEKRATDEKVSPAEPEAVFVPEGSEEDGKKIDDPADTEEAAGAKIENAGANFADIKTVDAQAAQEEAEGQGKPAAQGRGHSLDAGRGFVGVGVGVSVSVVDDDCGLLLRCGLGRLLRFCSGLGPGVF